LAILVSILSVQDVASRVAVPNRPPMPVVGRCATLRIMDQADSAHAELSAPGNIFYFVADLAAAATWYSARLGAGHR
jgi:hypothetical protein